MMLNFLLRAPLGIALVCAGMFGQTVSSSLIGNVVDPAEAVIAGAPVVLTNVDTGAIRTVNTDATGVFRFLDLPPGTYRLSIQAAGFKSYIESGIVLAAQETRDAGKVSMAIGVATESVQVTAMATPVQVASAEKSQTIDGNQLNSITLKGRDLFGYAKLVPGVLDTSTSRDVTSPGAIGGITINGNTSAKNFTVDGITDIDTGSNGTLHYEPNMDAIQELKILGSNYQAEFGRNSGGLITVVTKSGTQQFHGSGVWNHRHEEFNANSWLNNHTVTNGVAAARSFYRYNVETYSIGGPAYIPKLLNTAKKRFFFFWSQEYTGQFVPGSTQLKYTPTALERTGDFSKSLNNNGSLVTITDPTNGSPFPGNVIPKNRIDATGLAMLNYFPLPNYTPTQSQYLNVVNYFEQASAKHPRRNDVLRFDTYVTSKLSGYFRWINDHDDMVALYQGVSFTSDVGGVLGQKGISPIDHPNPGHGYAITATYAISPTMVNELTLGKSWNTWSWYSLDNYASEAPSLVGNPALFFPEPTGVQSGVGPVNSYHSLMPNVSYGSPPSNSMAYSRGTSTSAGAYENFNTIQSIQESLSKVLSGHTFKAGIYLERNTKIQPNGQAYNGSYNFGPSSQNTINNTGDGFANGLLGYVYNFSQSTGRTTFDVAYWNVEFYVEDNWRVNRKLTLDLGLRVYHQQPQYDLNNTFVNFDTSLYSKASVAQIYVPYCKNGAASCSGANRVGLDPATGATVLGSFIGSFVPGSGNIASGMKQLGVNGVTQYPYTQQALAYAPRLGFAYDVFGDGKTAVRGGFGVFYNRLDGNQVYGMSGQAPLVLTANSYFTTFSQIAATGSNLIFAPASSVTAWAAGQVPWDTVRNASIDVQHEIGHGTLLDVGYTGNWGINQNLTYNINPIAIGTRWPFTPSNVDPTAPTQSLPDVLLPHQYPGYNTISSHAFLGHTNYNALTASVQRRYQHGLVFGAAYTFSKSLGTTSFNPLVANNEAYNYGYTSANRKHNLQVSYSYTFPNPGSIVKSKVLGAVTDHWTLSGVTSVTTGAPYTPGMSFTSGTQPDYTGTPDISARINVVGDPLANVSAGAIFNPNAFALPALGTAPPSKPVLGNAGGGSGLLVMPRTTNFDATMTKTVPLGRESRRLEIQVQAYNVFNHTEYNSFNTTIQFVPSTGAVGNASSVGVPNGTLPNRILAFSARLQF